jgi:thymidylate kinase
MIEDKFNNCVNVDIEDDKYLETIKNDLLYIDLPEEEIKKNISNNKNTTDIDNNTNNIDDNYNNILDDDQNKIIIDRLYDDDIIND